MGIQNDVNDYTNTSKQNLGQYQNVISQNTGLTGFNNSLNQAREQSQQGALNATASASNQAIQSAQQAGLSKAQAAMNAGNTAANTYANAYSTGVNQNQNLIQNYQNQAVQASSDIYNKQQQAAQMRLNTAIADYQRKLQHVQQLIQIGLKAGGALYNRSAVGSKADIDKSTMNNRTPLQNTFSQSINNLPASGANIWNGITSDVTTKEPIDPVDDLFKKLDAIKFKYTPKAQDELNLDNENHVGLSAQEVEKADPDLVTEKDGKKAIDTQKLVESTAAAIALLSKKLEGEE